MKYTLLYSLLCCSVVATRAQKKPENDTLCHVVYVTPLKMVLSYSPHLRLGGEMPLKFPDRNTMAMGAEFGIMNVTLGLDNTIGVNRVSGYNGRLFVKYYLNKKAAISTRFYVAPVLYMADFTRGPEWHGFSTFDSLGTIQGFDYTDAVAKTLHKGLLFRAGGLCRPVGPLVLDFFIGAGVLQITETWHSTDFKYTERNSFIEIPAEFGFSIGFVVN